MIQLPRRSLTRFFIPLIDVLILLFGIFLIMPMAKSTEAETQPPPTKAEEKTGADKADLAAQLEKAQKELADIHKSRPEMLRERILVQVLEIDGTTGNLYHRGQERTEIAREGDALVLIDRLRREAGSREVYYLFLFPRVEKGQPLPGYPTEGQVQHYRKWFQGTAYGFESQ